MLGMSGGMELGESASWPTMLMYSLFMAFVVVVLLNLLIAIMSDSYEKVKESERVEALRERARIIVEAELTHPSWHRYHRYMHIVEAADTSEMAVREWEGITGRVKQLLEMEGRRVDGKFSEIESKFDAMDNRLLEAREEAKADAHKKFEELKTLMTMLLDSKR
jgi:hypothetical protein